MHSTMRIAAPMLVLPLLAAAPRPAPVVMNPGVVFEMETKNGNEPAETITVSVEGQNVKMQTPPSGGSKEPGSMIFHGAKREMIMVRPENKTYFVLDEATMKQLAQQMSDAMTQMNEALANVPAEQRAMMEKMIKQRMGNMASAPPTPPVVKRTSERQTINGYPTVKYEVTRDGKKTTDLWVTDWNAKAFQEVKSAFEAMSAFMKDMIGALAQGPLGRVATSSNNTAFELIDQLNGYPVMSRTYDDDGKVQTETTLKSATQKTLAPSEFEPPDGYKRQSLPGGGH